MKKQTFFKDGDIVVIMHTSKIGEVAFKSNAPGFYKVNFNGDLRHLSGKTLRLATEAEKQEWQANQL